MNIRMLFLINPIKNKYLSSTSSTARVLHLCWVFSFFFWYLNHVILLFFFVALQIKLRLSLEKSTFSTFFFHFRIIIYLSNVKYYIYKLDIYLILQSTVLVSFNPIETSKKNPPSSKKNKTKKILPCFL